jgi:glyoxylase-like metal-dependent hydrolase (beta-lactamase superfamily II)
MVRYGDLRIHPLPEGRFTVGSDKRFVPHEDAASAPRGTLFISVTPFLVETPAELLLLDTGLGEYATGRDVTYLLDGIRRAGFEREDVGRVILSHLHFDHCGGAVINAGGFDQPTFPDAVYTVQRGEVDSKEYSGVSRDARERVIATLDAAGQLERVEGTTWVTPDIEVELTGGHTSYHQIVRLHTGGRVAVFGGDVLPAPAQIKRRFRAKYDVEPAVSQEARSRLTQEAAEHGHLLLLYHSPTSPCAFVSEGRHGLEVESCM